MVKKNFWYKFIELVQFQQLYRTLLNIIKVQTAIEILGKYLKTLRQKNVEVEMDFVNIDRLGNRPILFFLER